MWKCTGKLGRADDLHLKEVEYPQQKYTDLIQCLKECLEDFLDWSIRGICIAVICGAEGPSYPNDSLSLLDAPMQIARYISQGQYIKRDGQVTTTLTNEYVCIAIRHEGGDDLDAMLGNLYAGISKILKDISEDTVPIQGNDLDVRIAKTVIEMTTNCFGPASNNLQQERFVQGTGKNLDESCVLDHFPCVKILVFMPEDVYEAFGNNTYLFFKQIQYVIRIGDTEKVALQDKVERLMAQVAEKQAQIDAAEAKAEELQAQCDAAVAEAEEQRTQREAVEAKAGDLTEQIKDLTDQVKDMTAQLKKLRLELTQMTLGHSLLVNSDLRTDATNETVANVEIMQEGRVWVDPNFEQPHLLDVKPPTDKQNSQDSPNKGENLNEQEHQMKENLGGPDINKDDLHNPINDDKSNGERERDHDYDEGRDRD